VRAGVSSRWWKDLLLRCDDGGSHAGWLAIDVVGADDDGPNLDIFSLSESPLPFGAVQRVRRTFTDTSRVGPELVWSEWYSSVISLP